jgi:pyruvate/2-oxoglutarate dehydrogenase complex dihydrolipoamide acyltransferase (E2) component
VAGLVEIDVTEALEGLAATGAPGKRVSFFAWMVKRIGDGIATHPGVHALRSGRRRLHIFDEVDISIIIEKKLEGSRVPIPLLIRNVNGKSAAEIQEEIRSAQKRPIRDEGEYVLSEQRAGSRLMRFFYLLPQPLRLFLMRRILRNPHRSKAAMGTAVITSLGSVGRLPGWIIPKTMHNLCFALGSVIKKPWVCEGRIEIREIMHMTVIFDHDVVDGAPAMRFMVDLIQTIEEGTVENHTAGSAPV